MEDAWGLEDGAMRGTAHAVASDLCDALTFSYADRRESVISPPALLETQRALRRMSFFIAADPS
jgi:hypothetical protein